MADLQPTPMIASQVALPPGIADKKILRKAAYMTAFSILEKASISAQCQDGHRLRGILCPPAFTSECVSARKFLPALEMRARAACLREVRIQGLPAQSS
ncbi:hypothetical protein WJX75_002757 [Coccomyxa subellipsoidea]|uniref:Uncharacterized protein n=1 Tax=Coccomyxa subellipsoidea TaxID=248742 RepID=A0ABR2Z2T0_9CHLO